jgi:type IV secretory pathway VirB2 component (pilin)
MKWALTHEKMMTLVWCLVLTYAAFLVPADALAFSGGYTGTESDSSVIGDLLCNVAGWFSGTVGKGIATLAIIVIGIGALMGKVSWGMAIIVGLGVAVVFGAPQIVNELGGDTNCV